MRILVSPKKAIWPVTTTIFFPDIMSCEGVLSSRSFEMITSTPYQHATCKPSTASKGLAVKQWGLWRGVKLRAAADFAVPADGGKDLFLLLAGE